MDYEDADVKIKIISPKKKGKLLANATIVINTATVGAITIKGFQIWPSPLINERLQEQINITPPSIFTYGRPFILVFFESKNYWVEMEYKIYSAYCHYRKKSKDENIEPTNIPF